MRSYWRALQEAWYYHCMDAYYTQYYSPLGVPGPNGIVFAWEQAYQLVMMLVCHWFGHTLVDTSYGGPESGCMSGHCTRCQWSYHHQLY